MARVLLTGFCAVPGPRRAGVQLRHVIRSLTPLHTVDLLVSREGDQAYVERQGSVRVLRVPTHEADLKSQVQAFQRALKRQLDGADYDFVHCRDSWSGIPVLEARARMGFAVVYDLTRSPLGETTFDTDLDAQYGRDEEACLLAADLILAPTAAAVKSLQARGRPDRVILSPPGVDVDRFDWDDVTSAGSPRILYVGSIDPGRGVRVLVRAMAAIVREVDAKLVIAGPMATAVPKFEQGLRDGIRELGLSDKIDVLGPVDHDQLPALLATATVCVVPAASDLTPNPTVVYPTKLLEYMACRCAIVAPRRDTVMQVVDNNREALLFEPGDPIDLARKVLRLLDEPALRRNLAHNAYERVRRDFTASAARRAIRNAYAVLTERYADQIQEADDDAPKVEILADDDFEATVFEEAPNSPDNTAENKIGALDDALASLDEHTGSTSSESIAAPPAPADETVERSPVPPGPRDTGAYTVSRTTKRALGSEKDDWVVTNVGRALDDDDDAIEVESGEIQPDDGVDHDGHDGTPIEGVVAVAPPLGSMGETTFVAGEIDVPTPPPEREAASPVEIDLEQLRAGSLLGSESPDPDTGSRTPPLERR
jgi:glycosyltransferase involved in cell wall biosynthesis